MPLAKRRPRHRCEVTYDRLVDDVTRLADKFTGAERDAVSVVCQALWEIAEGQR